MKAVKLATKREEFIKHARTVLGNALRAKPKACIVVYQTGDGGIVVDAACLNRLEMVGALHAAIVALATPQC